MKKLILLLLFGVLSMGCTKKDEPTCQGIDCLPPPTQTGAGTFGCLVNGVPFVDKSGNFNCFYQLVNGDYYFGIKGQNNISEIQAIELSSLKKVLLQT